MKCSSTLAGIFEEDFGEFIGINGSVMVLGLGRHTTVLSKKSLPAVGADSGKMVKCRIMFLPEQVCSTLKTWLTDLLDDALILEIIKTIKRLHSGE